MDPFEPHDPGQGPSSPTDAPPPLAGNSQRRVPPPTPGPAALYPEKSQAGLSLVLSLLGLVLAFPILSPIGWYYAQKEIAGIDAGQRDPSNRGKATAGKVLGIIGTIFLVLAVIGLVVFVAIFVTAFA